MVTAAPPRSPRRWSRAVARVAEVGTILVATGALALWCSIPKTGRLADENPVSTAFIDLRRDQAAADGHPFKLEWQWRPLGKISRYLRASLIYAEDYNFYRHDGVDWDAVEQALDSNLDKGAVAVGGSTITQQLAKNLYLSPSRSLVRKLREMLIAFSLEDHLTKTRILELYVNVVEWGDGVFGAEAASRHWFGHSAQTLSPAEAVRLAIALPNPIKRAPNVRSPELTKKSVRLIRLLRMQGLIDSTQERTALDAVGAPEEAVLPAPGRPGSGQAAGSAAAGSAAANPGRPDPAQPGQPDPGRPDPGQHDPGPVEPTRPDPEAAPDDPIQQPE